MCRYPIIVSPTLTCAEALAISRESDEHFLLVVEDERLLGVAQACDLRRAPANRSLRDCMLSSMPTIGEGDSVSFAERLLTLVGVGCLVVVDAARAMKGTLTCQDLNRAGARAQLGHAQRCAACGCPQHLIFTERGLPLCCDCSERRSAAEVTTPSARLQEDASRG